MGDPIPVLQRIIRPEGALVKRRELLCQDMVPTCGERASGRPRAAPHAALIVPGRDRRC